LLFVLEHAVHTFSAINIFLKNPHHHKLQSDAVRGSNFSKVTSHSTTDKDRYRLQDNVLCCGEDKTSKNRKLL